MKNASAGSNKNPDRTVAAKHIDLIKGSDLGHTCWNCLVAGHHKSKCEQKENKDTLDKMHKKYCAHWEATLGSDWRELKKAQK